MGKLRFEHKIEYIGKPGGTLVCSQRTMLGGQTKPCFYGKPGSWTRVATGKPISNPKLIKQLDIFWNTN